MNDRAMTFGRIALAELDRFDFLFPTKQPEGVAFGETNPDQSASSGLEKCLRVVLFGRRENQGRIVAPAKTGASRISRMR